MSKKFNNIKHTGFKIPKDYFESIEDSVLSKLKQEDLSISVNETGFKTPENYLDGIEDKVFSQLNQKDTKVVSLWSRQNILYMSGVAAAIVILFSVFSNNIVNTNQELDYDIVESYILEQDISSYELASLLTEEELSSINSDIMDEAFTDDEMEDYLLENVNLEDIIEQ